MATPTPRQAKRGPRRARHRIRQNPDLGNFVAMLLQHDKKGGRTGVLACATRKEGRNNLLFSPLCTFKRDLGPLAERDWGRGIVSGIVSKFEAKRELIFLHFFWDKTIEINPQKSASNCFDENLTKFNFKGAKTTI
jgi:hypothetical protein